MYLQKKLLAKKLCCEIAMQSVLQEWQREPVELKCPQCGSKKVATRPGLTGKFPRFCPICKHYFDQPDHFVCDCLQPGTQVKCHHCPNFRKLMAAVKEKAEGMQSLSLEELHAEFSRKSEEPSNDSHDDLGNLRPNRSEPC